MKYQALSLPGVYEIIPDIHQDNRGSLTKLFDRTNFEQLSIDCQWNETLLSINKSQGIIRGFHYQAPPYGQTKMIYCLQGAAQAYLLDIRQGADTYGKIITCHLSPETGNMLIVPIGVANAYMIEQDNTHILYQLTSQYQPDYESGIRWDSVGLSLNWDNPIISERDSRLPKWEDFTTPFIWGENC